MGAINIIGISEDSVVDGEGLRDVIFVSGCDKKCLGCHSQGSWDPSAGDDLDIDTLVGNILAQPLMKGLTISGGDPLSFQQEAVLELLKKVKEISETKDVWLYTGMTWSEILNSNTTQRQILKYVDTLVVGRFEEDKRDITLRFVGSSNQEIIENPLDRVIQEMI